MGNKQHPVEKETIDSEVNLGEGEDKNKNEWNSIPNDQFLCPHCERVPEILNVFSDTGHIKLKCSFHGEIIISIKDYLGQLKDSEFAYWNMKCEICGKKNKVNENKFQFCFYCKKVLCEICLENFNNSKVDHREHHKDVCIPVKEMNNRCLEHFRCEITDYCEDCSQNICNKERKNKHNDHQIINLSKFVDLVDATKKLKEKNEILKQIIKFNEIILTTTGNYYKNYNHVKSLINVGKSLNNMNLDDIRRMDIIMKDMEKSNKIQKDAIKSLHKKKLDFKGDETSLGLRKRDLGDDGLKFLSEIKFTNLISMNLSENNIKNAEPLNNMPLVSLEMLDMSENMIEDVKPIANISSKNLRIINLESNKIKDLKAFLNSNFEKLEILRVENNDIDKTLKSFKKIMSKFKNKIVTIALTKEGFKKKYNESLDKEKVDLSGRNGGDDLIKELYLLIGKDNKIQHLNLMNNDIRNLNLLTPINFTHLRVLDLSGNNIHNLEFLYQMKMINLHTLYLNNNNIINISPLVKINDVNNKKSGINFPSLKLLSLKKNQFDKKAANNIKIINYLSDKGITLDMEKYVPSKNPSENEILIGN